MTLIDRLRCASDDPGSWDVPALLLEAAEAIQGAEDFATEQDERAMWSQRWMLATPVPVDALEMMVNQ